LFDDRRRYFFGCWWLGELRNASQHGDINALVGMRVGVRITVAGALPLTNSGTLLYAQAMRDRDTIDSELRRLAALRRSIREHGGELSTRQIDELLDERLGHRPEASEPRRLQRGSPRLLPTPGRSATKPTTSRLTARRGVLRRVGLPAALPLSLVAVAAAAVAMFTVHNTHPAAQPTVVPPSSARPSPAVPKAPDAAAPKAPVPPVDIVDRALIDALKQEGVPVPSREYVTIHGHAVCDFLAHQPNFEEAVSLVQRTSIWDANQSADFVAGAIVSYCPQYKPATQDQTQQASQNALSDLQRIEGDLQRIQGDLQGIRDDLPAIPGH
jgi:Protein of unknown function (DUF732)